MSSRMTPTTKERMLRRATVFVTALAAFGLFVSAPALGLDSDFSRGSHGFTFASDACALCHRTHTGVAKNLLKSNSMCVTCHSGLMGADTNIVDGTYADSKNPAHSWNSTVDPNNPNDPNMNISNPPLLAGGFKHVGGANTVTSAHQIGDIAGVTLAPVVPYGSTTGASISLGCTSCHSMHTDLDNPKSATQYRLLRTNLGVAGQNLTVTWNGPWTDATQTTPTTSVTSTTNMAYTERDFSNDPAPATGLIEYTRNYKSGMSAWCEGCHAVYGTPDGASGSPDNVAYHRHKMDVQLVSGTRLLGTPTTDLPLNDLGALGRTSEDLMNCATCHRAHGTDSTIDGPYVTAAARTGLPSMNTSMLLRLDNRGVCINCHSYLNADTY